MLTKKHLSIISEQQNKPPALKIQMTKKLKCGCVPGHYDCPQARQLWGRALDIYEEWTWTRADEDWQRYQEAKQRYDKHVQADE